MRSHIWGGEVAFWAKRSIFGGRAVVFWGGTFLKLHFRGRNIWEGGKKSLFGAQRGQFGVVFPEYPARGCWRGPGTARVTLVPNNPFRLWPKAAWGGPNSAEGGFPGASRPHTKSRRWATSRLPPRRGDHPARGGKKSSTHNLRQLRKAAASPGPAMLGGSGAPPSPAQGTPKS